MAYEDRRDGGSGNSSYVGTSFSMSADDGAAAASEAGTGKGYDTGSGNSSYVSHVAHYTGLGSLADEVGDEEAGM